MKVLYSTHTSPELMPPLAVSEQQIIVGPKYSTDVDGNVVRTLNVAPGRYDLAALISSLPVEQKPDLTIVLADAYQYCMPEGLADVPGRKLLLVADTHHGRSPLQRLLDYARQEPFDGIVITHDPHHLHWFAEADIAPTTYIPNVNCRYFPPRLAGTRRAAIIFVGQAGRLHRRRQYLLKEIHKAGLPLIVQRAPAPVAATLYDSTQITFNCSLNGDLNMRVFEVLAAGGFLVTDRLSPQSGLGCLFRSGEEYVEYDGLDELLGLLRYYLANPEECFRIAKAGHEAYLKRHHPQRRIGELIDFAYGRSPVAICKDRRAVRGSCDFGKQLGERVSLYELLQDLSLQNERMIVLADPALGARVISDLVDLPRLQILVGETPKESRALKEALRDLGVLDQIKFADTRATRCDIQLVHGQTIASEKDVPSPRPQLLAVMRGGAAIDDHVTWLESHGFRKVREAPWLFQRVD